MKTQWQLQDAKNRLSRVVKLAVREGPQTITLRGKPAAVLVSFDQYRQLTKPKEKLSEFFKQSPLYGSKIDLERKRDLGRKVDL